MYPSGLVRSGIDNSIQKPFGQMSDKPSEGDFRGDSKGFLGGFLDRFKSGAKSYTPKEKDSTDKYLDFLRETRNMSQGGAGFGGMLGGKGTEVAEGLNIYQPPTTQQMFIPGQEGKPGIFGRLAGAALGAAMGPIGAGIGKAVGGMFG